jgi:3-methyladenine DNA glycosylase/8-oxoguanine DNA glycosylase
VNFPHPPPATRAALDRLTARDPDPAAIERGADAPPWRTRPTGFPSLLQAIIGQQISNRAAARRT